MNSFETAGTDAPKPVPDEDPDHYARRPAAGPPRTDSPGRRLAHASLENALACAAKVSAALIEVQVGYPGLDLTLCSLASPLVFAVLVRRGTRPLPGLFLGALLVATLYDDHWSALSWALGTVIAAWLAWHTLNRLYARWPRASVTTLLARLLLVTLLVQVPATTGAAWPAIAEFATHHGLGLVDSIVGFLLLQACSAVLFTIAFVMAIPARPGQLPIRQMPSAWRSIEWSALAATVAVTVVCMAALWAFAPGPQLRQLAPFAALAVPTLLLVALHGSPRTAGTLLAACGLAVLLIWTRIEPPPVTPLGQYRLIQLLLALAQGGVLYLVLLATALEQRRQSLRLRRRMVTDAATGLSNERGLEEALFAWRTRTPVTARHFVQVTIDDYDALASSLGREAARDLSRALGERLVAAVPVPGDCIASIAEDRFVLMLPGAATAQAAYLLVDLLHAATDGMPMQAGQERLLVRTSLAAIYVPPGEAFTVDALLGALAALSARAAASTRRRAVGALAALMADPARRPFARIEAVKQAIHERRVLVYAQPIVPVAVSGSPGLHFEVLVRLQATDGAMMMPADFLPAVGQARMLREFDRLVIACTLDVLAGSRSLREATSLAAINVTGPTLSDPEFADYLESELARTGVRSELIGLEVTESESIGSFEAARENIARLGRLGIRVAIDDFGTGLATFDYIKRIAAGSLKIDGSFVRRVGDDPVDRAIVQSIVRVARVMGATTVAECVETVELAVQLEAFGVDYLQGYGIARPMPIADLHAWHRPGSRPPSPRIQAARGREPEPGGLQCPACLQPCARCSGSKPFTSSSSRAGSPACSICRACS